MIETLPALVSALHSCPKPETLALYRGYDWHKLITDKYNSTFDIVKNREWSLSFHRWLPDDIKRIEWWKHYEHSIMPIHNPILIDDIFINKWKVKTIDFQVPIVTSRTNGYTQGHNFTLHLFGRGILPDQQILTELSEVALKPTTLAA